MDRRHFNNLALGMTGLITMGEFPMISYGGVSEQLPFDPFARIRDLFTVSTTNTSLCQTFMPNHGYLPEQGKGRHLPTYDIGSAVDWPIYTSQRLKDRCVEKHFYGSFLTKIEDDAWQTAICHGRETYFAQIYKTDDIVNSLKRHFAMDNYIVCCGEELYKILSERSNFTLRYQEKMSRWSNYDHFIKKEIQDTGAKEDDAFLLLLEKDKVNRLAVYEPNSFYQDSDPHLSKINREGIFGAMTLGIGVKEKESKLVLVRN